MNLLRRAFEQSDLMVAVGIIGLIAMMVIPLPLVVLDILITLNIALALSILLVAMYTQKPLDFSIFPSLLLVATLFRLALNISSTRLILLHAEAGQVIEAFGNFVVGGDMVVGLILFLILVIIQFVVITSGSQRVAEVAARFTLDEMPGKQMSIDADLNAGLISEQDARERRRDIEREADFYGAMDGATKFVRGDAIAGVIIVVINIIAGLIIGVVQHQMPVGEALRRYALLTVGDGLVSQIPALLISTATGLVVTRAASQENLGTEVISQIIAHPRAIMIVGAVLVTLGLVPGLPKLSFLMAGAVTEVVAWFLYRRAADEAAEEETDEEISEPTAGEELEEAMQVDRLCLELGYNLVNLVGDDGGGDLLQRIGGVRKRLAAGLGLVLPPVRIRDDMGLSPHTYVIKLKGAEVGRGEVYPNQLLAMATDPTAEPLGGQEAEEPVFGLPAWWIDESNRAVGEARGYTVVEPTTVIATHLSEIARSKAAELLNRQDVQGMIERVRQTEPAVVNELIPDMASVGQVQQVLKALLAEQVPIRDMPTILETMADALRMTEDLNEAVEVVRAALARTINDQYRDEDDCIRVITLAPEIEREVADNAMPTLQGPMCALEPSVMDDILSQARETIERATSLGQEPVILTAPGVRRYVRALFHRHFPDTAVLSHSEITPEVDIEMVGTLRPPSAAPQQPAPQARSA